MGGYQVKATAQIFLSYAREDEEKAEKLHQKLSSAGFKPWMDRKDILPGEQWESSIRRAVRNSDFFLACLSANSVDKRGWIQKEIKQALDIWQEKLEDDIYLIPVRLEDCDAPESLSGFQWVNLFEEDGWTRLVKAIQVGMERLGEVPKKNSERKPTWPPTLPWNEPYYYLPERDQSLVKAVQVLIERDQPRVVLVSGLGGVGKTAAAIEIGRRCLANGTFKHVLGDSAKQEMLIDGRVAQATDRAVLNFSSLLDELGAQLDRPDIRTMLLEEKRLTVQRLLHQSSYLVIVDNLETAENAAQIVRDLPPLLNASQAIITSRELIRQDGLHLLLQLEGLTPKDSLIFLREDARRRGCTEITNAPDETLLEIRGATGGQPLAMKLVVGQSLDVDLSFVLRSLRQARGEIYNFIYLDSWRRLSPPAKNLLLYLGQAPASVPHEELLNVPIGTGPDDLLVGMQELIRLSLVNVTQGAGKKRYTVHQLTRHFVNGELPELWRSQGLL
jgi:hypothetical protein